MNLIHFTLYDTDDIEYSFDPSQEVLYDKDRDKIIIQGDWYHDKVSNFIKGFLEGLSYGRVTFELNKQSVSCDYFDFDPKDYI